MKMELRNKALDKLYKRRDRIEMPDFQREEVWSDEQKRLLIDTILKGWHLPKLYFRKIDEQTYECVDGQQRLSAVWEFYDNKLFLSEETTKVFGGPTYTKLMPTYSDAFDDFELDIEELEQASDDELKDLFIRLQLGTPLTTAEKLNAVSGEARNFAHWIADQDFFAKRIGVRDTRYAHFDIASKWLFVEARGVQPQMRFSQLNGFLRENTSFSRAGDTAKRVKKALQYLAGITAEQAQLLRNRASVLSVCMLASEVIRVGIPEGTALRFGAFLKEFFHDLTLEVEKGPNATRADLLHYQEAISYGSTGADSIRERLDVLSRYLAVFDPVFAPVLRSVSETAPTQKLAKEIADLIYLVNESAATKSGADIFKMTNKSSKALTQIGAACKNESDFGVLVDDLYFLVYEGSGDCRRLPTPPPEFAMDIKFLRTHLRHDLDHGDNTEVARKRKRAGAVFKNYTGKKSLGECGPDELLAAQVRLLTGLKKMLEQL